MSKDGARHLNNHDQKAVTNLKILFSKCVHCPVLSKRLAFTKINDHSDLLNQASGFYF